MIDGSGTIVFRSRWSNSLAALRHALVSLVDGWKPSPATVGQTTRAMVRMAPHAGTAFDAAGRGALRDFWRVAPRPSQP